MPAAPSSSRAGLRQQWLTLAAMALCCACGAGTARAGVEVSVSGVDENLRTNVLAYLSFERYRKGGVELNADTVERLHNRVEREVQSALRPFGYYDPTVESSVTDHGHGNWTVELRIDPGKPVLVQHIDVGVDGPGASDPLFRRILEHLPLHSGERLNHAGYDAIKSDLQRTAATYGYLDARMTRNELRVDPPHHVADIALQMQTGERYHFGKTTIHQGVVQEKLVRRYLRYQEGDPLDLTQVLRTQFALDDSQYFTNLQVQPREPDRAARTVPVEIRADASRRHRYTMGGGYATDTGPRGIFGFEDHRINDRGHTFSVQVQASQKTRYSLQTRYAIPIGDPAVDSFGLRASVEQRDWGDVTTRTLSVGPEITAVTAGWQQVWALNAVRTSSESIFAPINVTDRLLVPELDLALVPKNYLGEALFEHPLFIQLKGSHSVLGSDSNWAQLHLQAERVFPLAPKWHLLLRGEVGATLVSRFSRLPTVFRFFAGGDNSVRGFGYNNLSPTVQTDTCAVAEVPITPTPPPPQKPTLCPASTNPRLLNNFTYIKVGGKDLLTGTVEVERDLPRNLGVAAFFDYGNAFDRFSTRLAYSVGVGLRVRLSVLTLGVDVARPLYEPCQDPYTYSNCSPHKLRLHINFSPKL